MIKIGTKLPATKQKSGKLLRTLSKRVVTKRDRKRGDATHGYAVAWKWACSACGKEYENQSDAEMCCAEKKDATGRPWLRKHQLKVPQSRSQTQGNNVLPYGLKLGATTYWVEDGKEYWSGDFDHCKFEDLLHNAKILRKLFKQHAKQFASSKPWACLKEYDKGVYINCEKLVKNTPIQVAATKICEHSLAVWKNNPRYEDKRTFEETVRTPEQVKEKCDNCKWGKDPDLVKHSCWECGTPDWKNFEKVEVSHKPEKKPWAFMKCRKCGESVPCFNDTPFATCRKCGSVFAQKASKPVKVKEGQPGEFYPNRYLVDHNKGGVHAETPTWIQCWNNDCNKQMIVCGFPWYICKNDHIINVLTGEKWNWMPSDKLYHELLAIQSEVEELYQKMFYTQSKLREHTESEHLSSHLDQIGENLYKQLQPIEPDPHNWGQDMLAHLGGLRFSTNLMYEAVMTRCKIALPNEDVAKEGHEGYTDEKLDKAWHKSGWQAVYEYDASKYRKKMNDETVKKLLLTINNVSLPKKAEQAKLKTEDVQEKKPQNFRTMGSSSGSPLPLAVRLKLEMTWTQFVFDDEPVLRVKKTEENKQILKAYINKTLKASKLFGEKQQTEITERIFAWSWRLNEPVAEVESHLKHEIGVAKHPLSKKPAKEILRLMRLCHPNEHGEVYGRFDVMDECSRRRKQLLIDLKWPTKPDSYYYNLYNGEKETLLQICGEDKWEPLSRTSHELAVKLSEATNNEYDHETLGLSCSTLKFWQNLIIKYPKAQTILREAVRLDKAFYEYKIHEGALLSALKLGDAPCEHNIIMMAKWLGIDITKLEPLDSIPKTDIYASVWKILEHYQPQPLTMPQKIENVRKQATSKKPAQAALTDFFQMKRRR